jgi:hypothetical protein
MMNYFIIPGNPPAVHFYKLWKKEIELFRPEAKVKICVYPRLEKENNSQVFFEKILLSHQEQLKQFYEEVQAPVTLIGHSLGGYFSLKLLEGSSDFIQQTILLHPFLRFPKKRGKLILRTVSFLEKSKTIQDLIVRKRNFLERFSDELPFVSDDELYKTFAIAKHEFKVIAQDKRPLVIDDVYRDKIRVFYHGNDTWCPPHVFKSLQTQISAVECSEPHGFITEKGLRQSLMKKILGDKK